MGLGLKVVPFFVILFATCSVFSGTQTSDCVVQAHKFFSTFSAPFFEDEEINATSAALACSGNGEPANVLACLKNARKVFTTEYGEKTENLQKNAALACSANSAASKIADCLTSVKLTTPHAKIDRQLHMAMACSGLK